MSLTLLHNQPVHPPNKNQASEDIATIVAEQLDELEQSADAPSEFSANWTDVRTNKPTTKKPSRVGSDHQERTPGNHNQQIEEALRQATHQKTTSDINERLSSTQKALRLLFRRGFILFVAESLHATVLRPIPVVAASLLSLVSGLALLLRMQTVNDAPLPTSIIIIAFITGYIVGLCIDRLKHRATQLNH